MTAMPKEPREIFPLTIMGFTRPGLFTGAMKEGVIPEGHVNGSAEDATQTQRDFRAVVSKSDAPEPVKVEVEKPGPKGQASPVTPSAGSSDPDSSESGNPKIQTETPTTSPIPPAVLPESPASVAKDSPLNLAGLPMRMLGEPLPPAETTGEPKQAE